MDIQKSLEQLLVNFLDFLPKVIAGVVVFIIALYISAWVARVVKRSAKRRGADPEIIILLTRGTRWTLIVLGIIVALEQVEFDVTGLIAGLGIAGVTVGFALQDVAKNFVAGVLLLIQQPFEIGDVIKILDYVGTVQEITLRTTDILSQDGRMVIVPNSEVFVNPLMNYSRTPRRRIEISAGVSYDSDLNHVTRTALRVIGDLEEVLPEPAPEVTFREFSGSTVDFVAYYWIATVGSGLKEANLRQAKDAGMKAIKAAFEDEGIDMPFPTMEIRMDKPAD
ncbi:MAG: mechanosensitive ion channel family protein [Anaerolineales bacterium]|jgi:small-conductance mechanosensitive channel